MKKIVVLAIALTCLLLPSCVPKDKTSSCFEHEYTQKVIEEATCSKEGVLEEVCSVCGNERLSYIDKTAHSYENGSCVSCGAEEPTGSDDSSVDTTVCDHQFEEKVVREPSCTEKGIKESTCLNCGEAKNEEPEYIDMVPHDFEDGKCKNCDAPDPNAPDSDSSDDEKGWTSFY